MGTNDAWMTQSSDAESDPLADDNFSADESSPPCAEKAQDGVCVREIGRA